MEGDARKVGDDDIAGYFVKAAFVNQVLNVAEGLGFRLAEVFPEALVLDKNNAGPEQIDVAVLTGDFLDRLFEAGNGAAADSEHVEEFVPEGLLLAALASDAGPLFREGDSAVADFIPGKWHGRMIAKSNPV